jgi:hypothetical protein
VLKATQQDHGTDSGWSPDYGDGRAVFGKITFSSSFYVFDGRVGGGPSSWNSGSFTNYA